MFSKDDTLDEFYEKYHKIRDEDYKINLLQNYNDSGNDYHTFLNNEKTKFTNYLETIDDILDPMLEKGWDKLNELELNFSDDEIKIIEKTIEDYFKDIPEIKFMVSFLLVEELLQKINIHHSKEILKEYCEYSVGDKYVTLQQNIIKEKCKEAVLFFNVEIQKEQIKGLNQKIKSKPKPALSNPKKLALLYELGIFDLPIMKNLTSEKQNEIIGLLLDADKIEFVYKNRLNIDSKNPSYQIDKYGAYKYLEEMQKLISDI
ncbi:hypothetical protein G6R40_06775 [Chryseobacterium sp. POL2]|uniref:hypothetical protein n=1 Tax=Chryseobacterium sp. POL2 TaxID=2713414 RepID=UPI0013E1A480|nr:hypothetical protein [Chryseobacterium sp. POL2]QIG89400.1 hypothetical protein G6R40_06775 [Chryseobacterium sp. POL2]